jgi:pimeloyl-ACP methyl ester carboxylesterase
VEVEHYKLEKIIGHMFEIIDTLGLKDIHLMGHDWGSAITWPMVLQRPELFRKFISMSVGHIGCFYGQAFETPERMYEVCMRNWYMYLHALEGMEELYMRDDFAFFRTFFCQHPEAEKVIAAIKETGRIEWLNYDKANHVSMDYLAYAKDPEGFAPNCKVPTMVMFPEDDMFLWKTQAVDTPSRMDAECRIEIIQGGHWSMLDHPDDVNRLMLEWFEAPVSTARKDVVEA